MPLNVCVHELFSIRTKEVDQHDDLGASEGAPALQAFDDDGDIHCVTGAVPASTLPVNECYDRSRTRRCFTNGRTIADKPSNLLLTSKRSAPGSLSLEWIL